MVRPSPGGARAHYAPEGESVCGHLSPGMLARRDTTTAVLGATSCRMCRRTLRFREDVARAGMEAWLGARFGIRPLPGSVRFEVGWVMWRDAGGGGLRRLGVGPGVLSVSAAAVELAEGETGAGMGEPPAQVMGDGGSAVPVARFSDSG